MAEISIRGKRVHFVEQGAGPMIVFLHAGGSSGKQWAKTAALLESRFRILAPDFWGFGNTEEYEGGEELTHDHQAELVIEVIRAHSSEPVHLVGHSYGGAAAVRAIIRERPLFSSCVLIEPILMPLLKRAGDERHLDEYLAMAHGFLAHAEAGRPAEAWKIFIDYRNGAGTWDGLKDSARERFCAGTRGAVIGFRSNLNNPTSIDEIEKFDISTLVMCGEKTTVPDRRVTEILRDHLPKVRYDLIPDAEHMSPLSHPAYIADAVERHVLQARV